MRPSGRPSTSPLMVAAAASAAALLCPGAGATQPGQRGAPPPPPIRVEADAEAVSLIGPFHSLTFDTERGALRSLRDERAEQEWLARAAETPPWVVYIATEDDPRPLPHARITRFEWSFTQASGVLSLHWEGQYRAPGRLQVDAAIRMREGDPLTRWTLTASLENGEIARIDFPVLGHLRAAEDPEAEWLTIPAGGGRRIHGPRRALLAEPEERLPGLYPGPWSMQFSTYSRGDAESLYLATEDGAGYYKRFLWELGNEPDALGYAASHFPLAPRASYRIPYPTAVGILSGGTWHAVTEYRRWAIAQEWCRLGPRRAGAAGEAGVASGAWLRSRGGPEEVVAAARSFRAALDAPVRLRWDWWHDAAYDIGFPDYFPPRGGPEAFRSAVLDLRARGIPTQAYLHGLLAGERSRRWEADDIAQYVARDAGGEAYRVVRNPLAEAPLAPICPATPYLSRLLTETTQRLADSGLAGAHLDGLAETAPAPCYAPEHEHAGPRGNYWVQHLRQALPRIRRAGGTDFVLTAGPGAETYLDLFDALVFPDASLERFETDERRQGGRWEPVPLFSGVYHEYVRLLGAETRLSNRQPWDPRWPGTEPPGQSRAVSGDYHEFIRYELARLLVWGHQPLVSDWLPGQEYHPSALRTLGFLRTVLATRERLAGHLDRGRLVELLEVACAESPVPVLVSSLYGPRGEERAVERPAPAVLASAWEDHQGRRLVLIVNHTAEEAEYRVELPERGVSIPWQPAFPSRQPTPELGENGLAGRLGPLAVVALIEDLGH